MPQLARAARALPSATGAAVRPSPTHALAGDATRSRAPSTSAMPRSLAPATIAAASGCSLPRSRLAASRSELALGRSPASGTTVTSVGLPSVSVPVLSTTSVSTFSQHLERLGVLGQHAQRRAPARRHHDRHRRREPERARARDDQHGDRVDERMRQPRLGADAAPRRRT